MTPRSLFKIFFKITCLILITSFLLYLIQFYTLNSPTLELGKFSNDRFFIIAVISLLIVSFLFYKLLKFIFFKTNVAKNKLKLEQHFIKDSFDLNIESKILLRYAIIIIGIVILYNSILDFIVEISNYFSILKNLIEYEKEPLKIYFIIEFIKIIIGYLFVFNSAFIVHFIMSKQAEINEENITEEVK